MTRNVEVKTIRIADRICAVCDSDDLEELWYYKHVTRTKNAFWEFENRTVICRDCGFVFSSPVPRQEDLTDYYADIIWTYIHQNDEYDVPKRLALIEEYAGRTYIEIGSDRQSEFHDRLRELFERVITVEPGQHTLQSSEYDFIQQVPDGVGDVLASYFVLEHVPDIQEMLFQSRRVLTPGGVMICEVPDLRMYHHNIVACHQHEHVNHFTPAALERAAARAGFRLVASSVEQCSRAYGFVSVFERVESSVAAPGQAVNEYEANKTAFLAGKNRAESTLELFAETRRQWSEMLDRGERFVVWGANDNLLQVLGGAPLPGLVCVDSDPKKRGYLPGIDVRLPEDAADVIERASILYLCTARHRPVILETIRQRFGRVFAPEAVRVLDRAIR